MKKRIKLWMARLLVMILVVTQIQPMPVQAMEIGDVALPETIVEEVEAPSLLPEVLPENTEAAVEEAVAPAVSAEEKTVTGISVYTTPERMEFYHKIEWPDDYGICLELTFSDGSTQVVEQYDSAWYQYIARHDMCSDGSAIVMDDDGSFPVGDFKWVYHVNDTAISCEIPYAVHDVRDTSRVLSETEPQETVLGRAFVKLVIEKAGTYVFTSTNAVDLGFYDSDMNKQFIYSCDVYGMEHSLSAGIYYLEIYNCAETTTVTMERKPAVENLEIQFKENTGKYYAGLNMWHYPEGDIQVKVTYDNDEVVIADLWSDEWYAAGLGNVRMVDGNTGNAAERDESGEYPAGLYCLQIYDIDTDTRTVAQMAFEIMPYTVINEVLTLGEKEGPLSGKNFYKLAINEPGMYYMANDSGKNMHLNLYGANGEHVFDGDLYGENATLGIQLTKQTYYVVCEQIEAGYNVVFDKEPTAIYGVKVLNPLYQDTVYQEMGWNFERLAAGLKLELTYGDGSVQECVAYDAVWKSNDLYTELVPKGYNGGDYNYVVGEYDLNVRDRYGNILVTVPFSIKYPKQTTNVLEEGEVVKFGYNTNVYKLSLEAGLYKVSAENGYSFYNSDFEWVSGGMYNMYTLEKTGTYYLVVYGDEEKAENTISVKKQSTLELTTAQAYAATINNGGETVWFQYVPEETGTYSIRFNSSPGFNKEIMFYVPGKDSRSYGIDSEYDWFYQFRLEGGKACFVRLDYEAGYTGDFTLKIEKSKTVTDLEILQMPKRTELYYGLEKPFFYNFKGLKLGVTFEDGSKIEISPDNEHGMEYVMDCNWLDSNGQYINPEDLPVGNYTFVVKVGASIDKVEIPFTVVKLDNVKDKLTLSNTLEYKNLSERHQNNFAVVQITEPGQYIITSRNHLNATLMNSDYEKIDNWSGYGRIFDFAAAGNYYLQVSAYDYDYTVSLVKTKAVSKIEAYMRPGTGIYYRFPNSDAFTDSFITVFFADGTFKQLENFSEEWYKYISNWGVCYPGTYNGPQWDNERQCYEAGKFELRIESADATEYRFPIEIKEVEEYDVSLTLGEKLNLQSTYVNQRQYVKVYCPEAGQYSISMGDETYVSYELYDDSFRRITNEYGQYCAFKAEAPGYYYLRLYFWEAGQKVSLSMEKLVPLTGITLHEDGAWYEYYGLTQYTRYAMGRSYTMYFQDGTKVTTDPNTDSMSDVSAKYGVSMSLRNPDGTYANWDETDRVPVGEYQLVVSSDGLRISDQRKYEIRDKSEITTTLKFGQTLTGLEANRKEHFVKVVFDKPGLYAFHTDAPWAYFNGFCDENNKSIYDWNFTLEGLQVDVKEAGTYYLSFEFNEMTTNTYTVSLETRKRATGLKILEYQKELYDGCYLNTVSGLGLRYELTFEDGTKESFVSGDELVEKYSLVHTVYSKDDLDYSYDDWKYPVGEYVVRVESMLKGLYDFSCDLDFTVISSEKAPALVIGDALTVQQENQLYKLSIPKTGTYEINVTTGNGWFEVFNQAQEYVVVFDTESDEKMSEGLQAGEYYLAVHNGGYGDKLPITFSVSSAKPVEITKQPVDVTVNKGATATVSVTATGDGLKYQWYYTSNGSTTYFNKSSNTTNTYTTAMDASKDGRKVYCVITDKYGNKVTSNTVTLKMKVAEVKITKQPVDVTVSKGATATVSVTATGEGLKYQWYYTSNGSSSYFNKSSNTTNTYSTSMDATRNGRKVYCVVTDKYGNKVTSNTVTLKMKVENVVKITKQPVDVTVSKGATATVSVTATGDGLKYQWYYTSNGSSSYFNKSGNTTNTYSTSMDSTRDGRKVYCVVTDKYGNKVTSNTVTLKMKVENAVKITKQPVDVSVAKGATATVSVTATGDGLKYQWYYTSNGSSSYFNKSGNTTNTYSTSMDATRNGRKVYCVVTDKYGNKVTSNTVTLKMKVENAVKITKQPVDVTVNKGATATVSVTASGEGLKYQWYYTSNGSSSYFNKSSNTTNTYSTSMDSTRDGRKVYCVVTDKYGNKVTSNTVTLKMSSTSAVKITKQPVDVTVAKGATAKVSITATGDGLKYQWYYTSNGSTSYFNKSSNTTNTYSTSMDATRDGRKVYCVVTDKYGNKVTSNTVSLKMSK